MKRTGWRFYADPNGTSASFQTYMDAYRDRIEPAMQRLANVSLECRPALEVIAQYGAFSDNLLYVDPPYLGSTRRAGRYSYEMSHESEHRELADALHECEATVILSGYRSVLYDELYSDWVRFDLGAFTGNAVAGDRDRVEVCWMNRASSNTLFDMKGADA